MNLILPVIFGINATDKGSASSRSDDKKTQPKEKGSVPQKDPILLAAADKPAPKVEIASAMLNDIKATINDLCKNLPKVYEKYLVNVGGNLMVQYPDSKMIHTEGLAYMLWALGGPLAKKDGAQATTDKLLAGADKYFPKIPGTQQYTWVNKAGESSAADAQIDLIIAHTRYADNISKGIWKGDAQAQTAEAKKLSNDFIKNNVYTFTDSSGKKHAIMNPGIYGANNQSHFFVDKGDKVKVLANISYSPFGASEELSQFNSEWGLIENDQYKMAETMLAKYGRVLDWMVVTIDKKSGEMTISDNIKGDPDFGYSGKSAETGIEQIRFYVRLIDDYINNGDARALGLLKKCNSLGITDADKLTYYGKNNVLTSTISLTVAILCNDTKKLPGARTTFINKVSEATFQNLNYFGNQYYDSSKEAFNQLLTYISLGQLNKLVNGSTALAAPKEKAEESGKALLSAKGQKWFNPYSGDSTFKFVNKADSISLSGTVKSKWFIGGTGFDIPSQTDLSSATALKFKDISGSGKIQFEIEVNGVKYGYEYLVKGNGETVVVPLSRFRVKQDWQYSGDPLPVDKLRSGASKKFVIGYTGASEKGTFSAEISYPEIVK